LQVGEAGDHGVSSKRRRKMGEKGSGWLVFASIMMIVAGIGNVIWGIAAVSKKSLLITQLLFANLTFWGVLGIIFGAILVIAGFAVLNKVQWARWFAIVWATVSIIFWLFVIWAFPALSILVIAIDVLVIYGLTEYGDRTPSEA
jgi:hypothetical protein